MGYILTGCDCCGVCVCPPGSGLYCTFTSSNCPELNFSMFLGSGRDCYNGQSWSTSPCEPPGNIEDGYEGDCRLEAPYIIFCDTVGSGVSDGVECPGSYESGDGGVCPSITLFRASETGYYLDFHYVSTYMSYDNYPVTDFSNPPCTVFPTTTYYTGGMPSYSGVELTVIQENPVILSGHVAFGVTEGDYCCPIWGSGCEGDVIIQCGEITNSGLGNWCCQDTPENITVTITAQAVSGSGDLCSCWETGYSAPFSKNPSNEYCGSTDTESGNCTWQGLNCYTPPLFHCSGVYLGGAPINYTTILGEFNSFKVFQNATVSCIERCHTGNSRYELSSYFNYSACAPSGGTTSYLSGITAALTVDSCDPFQLSGTGRYIVGTYTCCSSWPNCAQAPPGSYAYCTNCGPYIIYCDVDILVTERV